MALQAFHEIIADLTSFDDIRLNVFEDGINLLPHKLGGHMMDISHTRSVLSRQRRRSSHRIAAMSGNDFLVRLQAPEHGSVYQRS